MADQTLTINNADGSSKTFTINRDKFAGVSSMQVNGQTVTVDRTAVPKEQDRETTFGGTQSFTVKRDIDPLLNKVVGGAAAAYSLRDLNDKQGNNKVVRVRRSDNAEKDFLGNEVDKAADWVNGKQETTLPCDVASAAAAYSLRPVNSNYTGNIVRVRRGFDNAEQDFSDVSLIADWVGSGNDGFVTTWYDQSGNGNNATQSTASSQPKIVDGGVLVSDGIKFDGGQQLVTPSGISGGSDVALFLVGNRTNNDVVRNTFVGTATDFALDLDDKLLLRVNSSNYFTLNVTPTTAGEQTLYSAVVSERVPTLSQNNETQTRSSAFDTDITNMISIIGDNSTTPSSTYALVGSIAEIIYYTSDQSANRFKIESNINNHYGLYTNANDGFVTTWYDQSGNSNDATQSVAASQPKIVDGGSLVSDGIEFDGLSTQLSTASPVLTSSTFYCTAVLKHSTGTSSSGNEIAFGQYDAISSGRWYVYVNTSSQLRFGSNAADPITGSFIDPLTASTTLITATAANNSATLYSNSNSTTSDTYSGFSPALIPFTIGKPNASDNSLDGSISEIIIYNSDQSANRVAIETNINNYYDIY